MARTAGRNSGSRLGVTRGATRGRPLFVVIRFKLSAVTRELPPAVSSAPYSLACRPLPTGRGDHETSLVVLLRNMSEAHTAGSSAGGYGWKPLIQKASSGLTAPAPGTVRGLLRLLRADPIGYPVRISISGVTMKSFGRIEAVNKELWVLLSLFLICLLLNLLVDAQRMVLSFYTLPTLGSAYALRPPARDADGLRQRAAGRHHDLVQPGALRRRAR